MMLQQALFALGRPKPPPRLAGRIAVRPPLVLPEGGH